MFYNPSINTSQLILHVLDVLVLRI